MFLTLESYSLSPKKHVHLSAADLVVSLAFDLQTPYETLSPCKPQTLNPKTL